MDWTRRQGWIALAIVLTAAALLVLARLSSFGIWDPWELTPADLARQIATNEIETLDRPALPIRLVASGFQAFGIHEWSGRLPIALAGICAVLLAFFIAERFAGRRAGIWAALITATSPLFLFNARQMLGAAPAFAASAAVFFCASSIVFLPGRLRTPYPLALRYSIGWLVALALSITLATLASGVLLGVAPPLLGVGAAILARSELAPRAVDRRRTMSAVGVLVLALIFGIGAAHAVWADYAGFGYWTGGVPRGGNPPTWEIVIERLFHSFAPWSALLPLALARMLIGPPREPVAMGSRAPRVMQSAPAFSIRKPEEGSLRLALVSWIAFGFAAQTIFTARYGPTTFIPLVGAAIAVALLLRDVERSKVPYWGSALIVFLFVGLIVRDYRAYPAAAIAGLPAEGIEVPDAFVTTDLRDLLASAFGSNPETSSAPGSARLTVMLGWAAVLGLFGLFSMLGFGSDPSARAYGRLREELQALAHWRKRSGEPTKLLLDVVRLGAPVQLIVEQWRRGGAFAAWLGAIGALLLALVIFGLLCFFIPGVLTNYAGMTTLGIFIGKLLLLVPIALMLLVATARLALYGFAKLGTNRLVPAMVAAFSVAAYASLVFLPALSSHFSPREVYDTYNDLAEPNEPLGEHRVGGRAAAYYAHGEIEELSTQPALLEFLHREGRVWAAFPADDLASINREYRRREGRHLFVADARSARMILATNLPIEGRENQNYLAGAVLDAPPRPQHRASINVDNRIELLGYDLDLPHGSYVGPGEAFRITWYFRVTAPVGGAYQPFVHIDGPGQRINGDHEPVDGRYPVRLWEVGDIIVDRQELRVPANYQRGNLTIFIGFFTGEQRLEIVSGPEDDVNRARVGILAVR